MTPTPPPVPTEAPDDSLATFAGALAGAVQSAITLLRLNPDDSAARNYVALTIDGVGWPFDRAELCMVRPGRPTPHERVQKLLIDLDMYTQRAQDARADRDAWKESDRQARADLTARDATIAGLRSLLGRLGFAKDAPIDVLTAGVETWLADSTEAFAERRKAIEDGLAKDRTIAELRTKLAAAESRVTAYAAANESMRQAVRERDEARAKLTEASRRLATLEAPGLSDEEAAHAFHDSEDPSIGARISAVATLAAGKARASLLAEIERLKAESDTAQAAAWKQHDGRCDELGDAEARIATLAASLAAARKERDEARAALDAACPAIPAAALDDTEPPPALVDVMRARPAPSPAVAALRWMSTADGRREVLEWVDTANGCREADLDRNSTVNATAEECGGWRIEFCGEGRDLASAMAQCERIHAAVRAGGEQAKATASEPVCSTCNDTHAMTLGDRTVMCTHCPVPCRVCREGGNGAYCSTAPCVCSCHGKRDAAPPPAKVEAPGSVATPRVRERIEEIVIDAAQKARAEPAKVEPGAVGALAEAMRSYDAEHGDPLRREVYEQTARGAARCLTRAGHEIILTEEADCLRAAYARYVRAPAILPPVAGEVGPTMCTHCEKRPATCIGNYGEPGDAKVPACDSCCGHGNEDGRCEPIDAARASSPAARRGLTEAWLRDLMLGADPQAMREQAVTVDGRNCDGRAIASTLREYADRLQQMKVTLTATGPVLAPSALDRFEALANDWIDGANDSLNMGGEQLRDLIASARATVPALPAEDEAEKLEEAMQSEYASSGRGYSELTRGERVDRLRRALATLRATPGGTVASSPPAGEAPRFVVLPREEVNGRPANVWAANARDGAERHARACNARPDLFHADAGDYGETTWRWAVVDTTSPSGDATRTAAPSEGESGGAR